MALFKTNQKMSDGQSSNEGGKSSSFFFFTQNKKYLIKTMTKEEFKVMKKLLPGLLKHLKSNIENGRPSMLAKL